MKFTEITSENVEEFSAYIDADTTDDLDRTFFRSIGALGDDGAPVGAIVYELKNSENEDDTKSRIILLEGIDDEVTEQLLDEYKKELSEDEVTESYYETSNETLYKLLSDNGFSGEQEEGEEISVSVEDLRKLNGVFKVKSFPEYIKSISELSTLQYRSFIKNCLFRGKYGILEDLSYLPKSWFETEVSSCAVVDDTVQGILLIRKNPSGKLIAQLYVDIGPDSRRNLLLILAYSCRKITELYPEGTEVIVRRHSDAVRKLTDKLLSDPKGDKVYCGTRSEE